MMLPDSTTRRRGPERFAGPPGQPDIVSALREPHAFGGGAAKVDVIETHISYVFLVGGEAYKVKKALLLPFLDFSTLASRRRYCDLEVALNRRTAPSLYLGVVPIVERDGAIVVGGAGNVVEWAVHMRRFADDALLSRMLARDGVDATMIDRLAEGVAAFHGTISRTPPPDAGTAAKAIAFALDNLRDLDALVESPGERERVGALRAWTLREGAACEAAMQERRRGGFVRDCHGDLHLDNIAVIDGQPTPFDCIDFDPALRWGDVVGDIAFAAMDLRARGRADLARRFVDRYLEATGDYAGAALMPFYAVYRALVRAKVASIRANAAGDDGTATDTRREASRYLALATALAAPRAPALVLMHGFSGCGKSALSQALVESADVVRIRTDVERKRLHGLPAGARHEGEVDSGLYEPRVTRDVYASIAAMTEVLLAAGQSVVVDGTFLRRWQRDAFRAVAQRGAAAFTIVDMRASVETLRRRVAARTIAGGDPSDADVAVLEHQLASAEPLAQDELASVLAVDADLPVASTVGSRAWCEWVAKLGHRRTREQAPAGDAAG
jgi:aminoglycoside phosphotransferase family enzyme/predicted kinase